MKSYFVEGESKKWAHVIYIDERWTQPVSRDEVDRRMGQFITEYVRLSKEQMAVVVDFIWQSWRCHPNGPWPTLRITGDLASGKTTLLEVAGLLCFRPCLAPPYVSLGEVKKWCTKGIGFETLIIDEAKRQKHIRKTLPGARLVVDRSGFTPPLGGWTHEVEMIQRPMFMSTYWYRGEAARAEAIEIQRMIGTYLETQNG